MRYNPPKFDDELDLRAKLLGSESIKPIIAVDFAISEYFIININAIFQNIDIFEIVEVWKIQKFRHCEICFANPANKCGEL